MLADASTLGWVFPALAIATWIAVPIYAARARGRLYAGFSLVILTLSLPPALVLHARLRAWVPVDLVFALDVAFALSMAAAGVHLAHLVNARMRSSAFRWAVSAPGQTFLGAGMLAGPWLLILLPFRLLFSALDWEGVLSAWTALEAMPLVVSVASVLTSVTTRPETVRFHVSARGPDELPLQVAAPDGR